MRKPMNTSRTRLMAISGATLALVVAGTAVVSAHPDGDRGDRGERGERGRSAERFEHRGGGIRGERGERGRSAERFERRGGGIRGELRQRISGQIDDFVRRETTLTTEDGTSTHRVENGTLDAATETSLDYTLSTGETVSVTIGEDTNAIAFAVPEETAQREGRRWFGGPRLRPSEVAVSDIEAGSPIVVWSQSQDDGSFLAQRVVVQPDIQAEDDDSAASVDAADLDVVTLDFPDAVAA
jgi:hypothetical protein